MQRRQEGSHKYVRLNVNQSYLIGLQMLDLDVETVTLICGHHGEGLNYREIAQRLYKECRVQVTSGALTRIHRLLTRGREQILTARLGEDDLNIYPEIARTAISDILDRYAPINEDGTRNKPSEVITSEERLSQGDKEPLHHTVEIQEETPVITLFTPPVPPKSCPRCSGNMLFEEDMHGAYSTCINCGYVYEFGATVAAELENEGEPRQRRRQPMHGKLKL